MPIKFVLLGGGGVLGFLGRGGWKCRFYFYGRGDFSDLSSRGSPSEGTTLREAVRGNLPLRGFARASAGFSSRVLRGSLRGALRGSAGFSEDRASGFFAPPSMRNL